MEWGGLGTPATLQNRSAEPNRELVERHDEAPCVDERVALGRSTAD
jgi:hypothetical protein